MSEATAEAWRNGTVARVVVERGYPCNAWCVTMQNDDGDVLVTAGGEREFSMPHPTSRARTEAVARRLAKAHGVRAWRRDLIHGHVQI